MKIHTRYWLGNPFSGTNTDNITSIAITILVFYSSTWHAYNSILDSFKLQAIILAIPVILLTFNNFSSKNNKILITNLDILWSIFLVVFFISFRKFNINILADFIVYSFCIIFLILSKTKIQNYRKAFLLVKYMAVFYAIGVLVQFLLPEFYMQYILPVFNEKAKDSIIFLLDRGAYTGFTHQTAYTAGYLINGIGAMFFLNYINYSGKRSLDIIITIILFIALILTGKRAHLVFMFGALFITALYISIINKSTKKFIKFMVIVFFSLVILVTLLQLLGIEGVINRLFNTLNNINEGKDITSGRLKLYKQAWSWFLENPIIGIGWREFNENSLGILSNFKKSHTHNIYLQLLTETGILGLIVFLVPLIYTLYNTIKILKVIFKNNIRNISYWKFGLLFSLYSQIFFILYGFTGNVLTDKSFLSMYFFSCSITNTSLISFKEEVYYKGIKEINIKA